MKDDQRVMLPSGMTMHHTEELHVNAEHFLSLTGSLG